MRLLRTLWHRTRRTLNLGVPLLAMHPKSILVVDGWNHSFRSAQAVDRQNNPIPWYTYAAIHFLEPRLQRQLRVFEYGCGNSTLWYSKRVSQVIAVEHDLQWAK